MAKAQPVAVSASPSQAVAGVARTIRQASAPMESLGQKIRAKAGTMMARWVRRDWRVSVRTARLDARAERSQTKRVMSQMESMV